MELTRSARFVGAMSEPNRKAGVMVLCTGNSCRSQIAQAFLEKHAGERFPAFSAGSDPAPEVHPLTIEVMREAGVDLDGRKPRHLRDFLGTTPIHTLILVCDSAARNCPSAWPGVQQRLMWPFEDPAGFEGSDDEKLAKFREARDAIEARVREWVASLPR